MDFYSRTIRQLGLPCVSLLTQSNFWKLYKNLKKQGYRQLLAATQGEVVTKLRELLAHAGACVPFYQERLEAVGLKPVSASYLDDYCKIPTLTKADITVNFPDGITATFQRYEPWRYVSTSGTIQRMTVIQDFRKRDYTRAAQLLGLNIATGYQPGMRYMEIPPDICVNVCGASDTTEPNLLHYAFDKLKARELGSQNVRSDLKGLIERQLVFRRTLLPSMNSDGLAQKPDNLDWYIEQIRVKRPYVVKGLPIYLYLLARHILDRNIDPPVVPGGLMPMGASLTPHMKAVVQTAFKTQVHEDYGTSELGSVAAEVRNGEGLRPFSGLFHVEVIRNGRPAQEGELGKLVITDLYNYAMPLIRYEIGDVALVKKCTDTFVTCFEVQGRLKDCLLTDDGIVLPSDGVIDAFLQQPGILGVQVEQRSGADYHVEVVLRNGTSRQGLEIEKTLATLVGCKARITSRIVPTILPEPGGKFRFVKNLCENINGIF